MMELCDGEYQTFKAKNGAYVREHFFNTPELRNLVADWTDDEVWQLNRGGHDIFKIFAAYNAPSRQGRPDPDPGQDHQGLRHGRAGEAMNISHQQRRWTRSRSAASATASTCRCRTTSWKNCPT
jgi:pyruvate dehydrogenase E1 component